MKLIFMGTPDFAVTSLKEIVSANHEVLYVITNPDRPSGRGMKLKPSPIKEFAIKQGLEVLQPEKIKKKSFREFLEKSKPDICVVAAYGQILTSKLLAMPKYGCINIHASLLPAYRGASPINWAIVNGEKYSGITIMQMDRGMDTGDILVQDKVAIEPFDNAGDLHDKLAVLGSKLCVNALNMIEKGTVVSKKQTDSEASYAPILKKKDGKIDWHMQAEQINNRIRGLYPWPGSFTVLNGKDIKIHKVMNLKELANNTAGTIKRITQAGIDVNCGKGVLRILVLQLPGKKKMNVRDYLSGYSIDPQYKFM